MLEYAEKGVVMQRFSTGLLTVLSIILLASMALAGCAPKSPQTSNSDGWKWPERIHVCAAGSSGMAAYVSWTTIMERDTGMVIRVVPENNVAARYQNVASGDMFIFSIGKDGVRDALEATPAEYALDPPTGFQARIVWISGISYSGVFVRGDSKINSLADIKPGIRWSVWSKAENILKIPRSIACGWCQLREEDVQWIVASSTDGAVRAVTEGRADIMWYFPSAAAVQEASSSPYGIKFIDLNSEADPAGAARFVAINPMYNFAPMKYGVVKEAIGHWGTVGEKYEITRAESDPDLVYHFAKWLDENYEKYRYTEAQNETRTRKDLLNGLQTTYIPCHEGLIRYLKDVGEWTPAHDRRQAQNVALLTAYVNAYSEALKQAKQQGIEISSKNTKWIDFWENYKKNVKKLPPIAMHQSLTIDAPWVAALGLK
jgi:TRAP-type uncharacterized transport system substrate-binding protein